MTILKYKKKTRQLAFWQTVLLIPLIIFAIVLAKGLSDDGLSGIKLIGIVGLIITLAFTLPLWIIRVINASKLINNKKDANNWTVLALASMALSPIELVYLSFVGEKDETVQSKVSNWHEANKNITMKHLKFGAITLYVVVVLTMLILAITFALKGIEHQQPGDFRSDSPYQNWYRGPVVDQWWKQSGSQWDGMTWAAAFKVGGSWFALFFVAIILGISGIVILGSWLNGARWINKENPRVKGVPYVRTKLQNFVFRFTMLSFGVPLLFSFVVDAFSDITLHIDNLTKHTTDDYSGNVLKAIWEYFVGGDSYDANGKVDGVFGGPNLWFYQCFLSSLFIGFASLRRKTNWMPILLPMALIGAFRTWADAGDWGANANWFGVRWHRFAYEHVAIVLLPIFAMVADRQHYTWNKIISTLRYTFLMVFIPYVYHAIQSVANGGTYNVGDAGELNGISSLLKLKDPAGNVDDAFVAANYQFFFWAIFVPFGLAIIFVLISIYETLFYVANWSERKEIWARNNRIFFMGKFWRLFSSLKVQKAIRVPFGSPIELPKGKYIIENQIAYKVSNKEDAHANYISK